MSYNPAMWTDNVLPEPNSGCWLWTGRYARNGYGTYGGGRRGERVLAHRLAWQETNGPIPERMNVLHRCDVRGCVNPGHLFLGTARDNTQDMIAKGRARFIGAQGQSRKTHCPRGHPYDAANAYISKKGARHCRACGREKAQERRERKRSSA